MRLPSHWLTSFGRGEEEENCMCFELALVLRFSFLLFSLGVLCWGKS